jgi:DNA-binding transcriptional LysR family regulator
MEFRQLETFRVVAALLSFRKAAQHLHLTQSTVSAQIKALEEDVGARLFERLGRRICLTSAGESLLGYGRSLLAIRDEARSRLAEHGSRRCRLRVRMPQSLVMTHLPDILRRFHARHPQASLEVADCAFAELPGELRTGQTDAAFLLADSVPFADLTVRLLATTPLTFVRSCASDPAPERMTWDDLGRTRLFLPGHDCSYRMMVREEMTRRGIEPPCLVEIGCLHTLLGCVMAGQGVALVPLACLDEALAQGRLRQVELADGPLETGILLILPRGKVFSEELSHFLDICTAAMSDPPQPPASWADVGRAPAPLTHSIE